MNVGDLVRFVRNNDKNFEIGMIIDLDAGSFRAEYLVEWFKHPCMPHWYPYTELEVVSSVKAN